VALLSGVVHVVTYGQRYLHAARSNVSADRHGHSALAQESRERGAYLEHLSQSLASQLLERHLHSVGALLFVSKREWPHVSIWEGAGTS
jgi:hypothetical protein